ncbi:MAG: sigma 54-interacting transcriptional regulator, partial [Candidatus Aminicenantes bacterium]
MLYLLYLRNGFIKKFPLDKKRILLGRSKTCDFFLDEAFVSKEHAELTVHSQWLAVKDLGSTNGTFTETGEIREARIDLNQWFRIGCLKFFLKEGNAEEFVLSSKIQPLFNRISNAMADMEKTTEALNILYTETLVEMLQIGFSLQTYGNLFQHAEELLKNTLVKGCLLLVSKKEKVFRIESQWNYLKKYIPDFNRIVKIREIFQGALKNKKTNSSHYFCSFPVHLPTQTMVLIYIVETSISTEVTDFLDALAVEISVIHSLIQHNQPPQPGKKIERPPEIITVNSQMLNLLSQSKKIAASNLFVLIEGETGSGKELIARFIHHQSKRSQGNFIALNCAAIPENLMEVE